MTKECSLQINKNLSLQSRQPASDACEDACLNLPEATSRFLRLNINYKSFLPPLQPETTVTVQV